MLNGIWQEFLNIVKEEIGSRVVETWLKAVSLTRWDSINRTAYIQAPNNFVKDWLRTHYIDLFNVHLSRLFNVDKITIVFTDQYTPTINPINKVFSNEEIKPAIVAQPGNNLINPNYKTNLPTTKLKNSYGKLNDFINSNYLFETFVIGPNNSLAYSAAYAVTKKPGVLYNPLFIYGESGLGKTHLLHAIGNEIKKNNKNANILYQTADRFVTEFINAIRFDKIHIFKEKYKDIDVLLIDDIQFISNKDQTQEAFFHIFNALYESHKQIVFSSDNYPKNIEGLAERLRSRLEWGLVTDIFAPSFETKIAILKRKADLNNEIIPEEVFHFIASQVDSNVRELEGFLVRVFAFANLTNQKINLELAQKVLGSCKPKMNNTTTFSNIIRHVCKNYSYSLDELRSKSRSREVSFARQVAMYLMKQMTEKSLSDIGEFFNRKDHSTVLHAINKIEKLKTEDVVLSNKLKQIQEEINQ